jgi:hypothetical protein
VHGAQSEWSARYFTLYYDEEQEEYSRQVGSEEIQSDPEENDSSQGNQII